MIRSLRLNVVGTDLVPLCDRRTCPSAVEGCAVGGCAVCVAVHSSRVYVWQEDVPVDGGVLCGVLLSAVCGAAVCGPVSPSGSRVRVWFPVWGEERTYGCRASDV